MGRHIRSELFATILLEGDGRRPSILSAEDWAFFAPFLVDARSRVGRPAANHRRVLEAILWVTTTGSPWRELPDEFGNWNSVFRQYSRWTKSGRWEAMMAALADPDDARAPAPQPSSVMAPPVASRHPQDYLATIRAVRDVGTRPKFLAERMRRRVKTTQPVRAIRRTLG
jgi:transposase